MSSQTSATQQTKVSITQIKGEFKYMVKGYKVFNPDWRCRGFRYEVGQTYEMDLPINICNNGFHYCTKASDCFNYYSFDSKNKVAEIEALGEISSNNDEDTKQCTNIIKIVREISWQEVLTIVNEGKDNTGLCNTGNRNTGNRNTGNWNTGGWNKGDWNTGNRNKGGWNTGLCNTGDWNTGGWNTGNRNTGDWNSTNYSNGVFCTEEATIPFFNRPSDIKYSDWINFDARYILNMIETVFWVDSSKMTIREKELHPEHETTGGFLKTINIVEAAETWWNKLEGYKKQIIKNIPNFDSEIFYKMTGLRV